MSLNVPDIATELKLDDEAFNRAVSDFKDLSKKINDLDTIISEMMTELKRGFNTPAGVAFINSVEKNLNKPLKEQKVAIDFIFQTLSNAKTKYQTVFNEYSSLQAGINNFKKY